jgi:tRNA-specific 2-thiouridylase
MALLSPVAEPVAAEPVFVGLSGGVDSSVAALLMCRQGLRVEALFMKNWEEDDREGYCAAAEDLADAEAVARVLEIPLHRVNFATEYWERVFIHSLGELEAGRTPNPDILCNQEVKFRAFLDHARSLGAEHIVTGHYARVVADPGGYHLLKGLDPNKDQSYFLYTLDQARLARLLLPLGALTKTEVRRLAAEAGLVTHAKKDSTGICFIGERPFRRFLAAYLPERPGEIRTPEGRVLGRHDGLMYYTLGQRKGLGIGGRQDGGGDPWYVAAKDVADNALIVVQGHDHPLLFSQHLTAGNLHWVAGRPPAVPLRCRAKVRYRQTDQACEILGLDAGRYQVRFAEPQRAVTPGQSVVFYRGEECLGGGIIGSTSQQDR